MKNPMACFLLSLSLLPGHPAGAQRDTRPAAEFDSIFTPLGNVAGTSCVQSPNWDERTARPLFEEQVELLRTAYAAAANSDDDVLKSLITDSNDYRDVYDFIGNLRVLAEDSSGIKYFYQERFDERIGLHRALGRIFNAEKPDVLISIIWCRPSEDGAGNRFAGGYAYLSLIDGLWKFHSR